MNKRLVIFLKNTAQLAATFLFWIFVLTAIEKIFNIEWLQHNKWNISWGIVVFLALINITFSFSIVKK